MLLLNTPLVQQKISVYVSKELSNLLKTEVSIGKIDLGLINKFIIHDISLKDRSNKEMLKVARLAAKYELRPLFKRKIVINNVQLYGFDGYLEKNTPEDAPNYQFVLDAFAPKDSIKKETNLDLRINSILMRRGFLSYHVLSEAETPGKFNPKHMHLNNISANISLKALTSDSLNAAIKRLRVEEELSGFKLSNLDFKITGNEKEANVENFKIDLPLTSLVMDTIHIKYDSLEAFSDVANNVRFRFHLMPSDFALQDLSPFIPAFKHFNDPLHLEINANGTLNDFELPILSIERDQHFQLKGNFSAQSLPLIDEARIRANLSQFYADSLGLTFLIKNFMPEGGYPPKIIQNLGSLFFQGEVVGKLSDLKATGHTITDRGNVDGHLQIIKGNQKGHFTYSGILNTTDFEIGKLIGDNKLGNIKFNLEVNGKNRAKHRPDIMLKGVIESLDYNQYRYENITLDGEYKQGGFYGKVNLNDENGIVDINGIINTNSRTPIFNFKAKIDQFRPHELNLTEQYKDAELSVAINANFTGGSIEKLMGEISIDSLNYKEPDNNYFMEQLKIVAIHKNNKEKSLQLTSDFINGSIVGNYSYETLPITINNIVGEYLPSLLSNQPQERVTNNKFHFQFDIARTDFFATVLKLPLNIYAHTSLTGHIDSQHERLYLEGYLPRLRFKDKFIESGSLICKNHNDQLSVRLRFNNKKQNDSFNITMEADAKNDTIETVLQWGNMAQKTYSGKIAATTHFSLPSSENKFPQKGKNKKQAIKTLIDIHPTDIILNDTLWKIHPSEVVVDSGKIHINKFYIGFPERHLQVNGTISNSIQDTLRLDLKEINVGYVFDIVNLNLDFSGKATGPAFACNILNEPIMQTDLFFKKLGLNGGLLGDTHIHGEWHNDIKGIYLDAHIKEDTIANTYVQGYIYPLKPASGLDLYIHADSINLKFLHYYLESLTSDFNGRASGNMRLFGKFKGLNIDGTVFADASMKIDELNTTYILKDSIQASPTGLTLTNNRIFDLQGHQGIANGYVHFKHFQNLDYRLTFDVNNMLVLNTKESIDYPFYGTVYGSGTAIVSGNQQTGLNVEASLTTNRNTTFTYFFDNVYSATSNQFITFVDKTPRRNIKEAETLSDFEQAWQKEIEKEENGIESDIRLNIQIDATPDAMVRIIMDPIAGDDITCRGRGNIRAEFYNKGDTRMFGNYNINQGTYHFSLQEIIRKDFNITEGSSINFSGLPEQASLDINAKYTVTSASLNDLMPNASSYVEKTNIKVDCMMNLSGQLSSPALKLNLEIPQERDEVQALVRNYIPTEEQMQMQILYLLSIGKFYTPDNVDGVQNSNMMSSVLSSTLSGQLNNALSNIINSNDWSFGTNLSTGQKGWTDMEFETMLAGQLLNNRLRINGNFGYRDNPLANTNFVGDFEAEWLIIPSGDIRLRAYNETNDRYYTRTNLTTQGIGIIFSKDFNYWKDLCFWNKWKINWLNRKMRQKERTQ